MSGSVSVEPPPFQEAARCDVCNCSFNAFRRRHHCRCCGRTLCHEHSSNQMALPQFGIYTSVRVCSDCFNGSSGRRKNEEPSIPNLVEEKLEDDLSRLDISGAVQALVIDCKCGMPLCICAAVIPDPLPEIKMPDVPPVRSNPRPVKANNTQRAAESLSRNIPSSSGKPSIFFNTGPKANAHQDHSKYEVNGEGVREAIKIGDAKAVERLLDEGVDPNYRDKQGLSLLHLAALFNQTQITLILMERGASVEYKNAQGETAVECAPAMLQYKMRQKMAEGP